MQQMWSTTCRQPRSFSLGSRVLALQWAAPAWWVMSLTSPSLDTLTLSPFPPLRWVCPSLPLSFFSFLVALFVQSSFFFFPPSLLSSLITVSFSSPHSVCILSLVSCQTLDDDPVPTNNNNQWQSRPVLEWNNQQVCLWLIAMNMDQYASEFAARGVDGTQLLSMDSEKLKVSRNKIIY